MWFLSTGRTLMKQSPTTLVWLNFLVKKLQKQNLVSKYEGEIEKLLDKSYAEMIAEEEDFSSTRVWYLPHHGVTTVKKPDKLRVVYDCAAKYQGASLNDRCYQGPDLINNLLHVLLRFRQHSIAIQADIEAMYNQVVIPKEDRDCLRFLWYRIVNFITFACVHTCLEVFGVWPAPHLLRGKLSKIILAQT